MATNGNTATVQEDRLLQSLTEAREKLETADDHVVLDLSCAPRIDYVALKAIEELADAAERKGVKIVLSGVNVDIYKVLKLMKLASHFSFLN
jgi:anti-anti-sigma regulatory factor